MSGRAKVAAVGELLRPPNVFTAVADALAGLVLVRRGHLALDDPGLWCLAASACLYLGGMALNDVFDREVNARERPERPIPSGRVSLGLASALGWGFLAAGIAFAWLGGALAVGVLLATAIVAYDAWLKGTGIGFAAMGLCRGLDVFLPMSTDFWSLEAAHLMAPVLLFLYVTTLTHLAREEATGDTLARARAGVSAMAVVAGLLVATTAAWGAPLVAWLFVAATLARGFQVFAPPWRDASPFVIGPAIGGGILMIPLVDATFVAAAGHPLYALAVAAFALPALALRRFYSPT